MPRELGPIPEDAVYRDFAAVLRQWAVGLDWCGARGRS